MVSHPLAVPPKRNPSNKSIPTSPGHVQRNLSNLRPREQFDKAADFKDPYSSRAPDAGILEHERKRRVEAKCFELQVSLEDDGVGEEEVEKQVGELRERLLKSVAGGERERGSIKVHETHELGQAKQIANERLRVAMGIGKGSYSSFSRFLLFVFFSLLSSLSLSYFESRLLTLLIMFVHRPR